MAQSSAHFHTLCTWHDSMTWDSPQSVPSPWPLDSGEVSISSVLDRKSKPFNASSVSGSSLVSILAGDNDDEGFFLRIWVKKPKYSMYILCGCSVSICLTILSPSWIPHWSCPAPHYPLPHPHHWTQLLRSQWTWRPPVQHWFQRPRLSCWPTNTISYKVTLL